MARKVIITCAVTGSVHTPSMSPYLPITPKQIADEAVAACEAGAAIVHLHARDPHDGRPTPDPDVFMQFLPEIRDRCAAVINLSTGGASGMTIDQRLAAARRASPEMASLNMGSLNMGLFLATARPMDWKYDWEKPFLEGSRRIIFQNTFDDIEFILKDLGEGRGVRFEFECYDVGHLYTLAHFAGTGAIKPPFFVQTIFGILGGIGADPAHLVHMRQTADKLFGDDYLWSVLAAGRHQMPLCTQTALMGGNVRVGLEDSLFVAPGRLAKSNAEQVALIRRILADLALDVATPAEARAMLKLKGADAVAF